MRRVDQDATEPSTRSRRAAQRALGAACVTLALLGAAACGQRAGPAAEGAEHVLIAGHQLAAGTSFDEGLHEFAELVAEGSGGRVRVEVYPSAQLGSETALFENMRNGLVDLAVVSPGFIAEFVPEMSILSMPFLVTTREQRDAVLASDVAAELEELLVETTGNEVLTYFGGGVRQMFFTSDVAEPADLRGRLFRTQPSQVLADSFGALGMHASNVAYGELYSALQQDVVSGADNEAVFIVAENFHEAAPYLYLSAHEVTIRPVVISGHTLDRLPEDLREVVLTAGEEAGAFARELEAEADDAALEELREDPGVTVIEPDTEELAALVEPVWERYAAQWGLEDMLDEIRAMGR